MGKLKWAKELAKKGGSKVADIKKQSEEMNKIEKVFSSMALGGHKRKKEISKMKKQTAKDKIQTAKDKIQTDKDKTQIIDRQYLKDK